MKCFFSCITDTYLIGNRIAHLRYQALPASRRLPPGSHRRLFRRGTVAHPCGGAAAPVGAGNPAAVPCGAAGSARAGPSPGISAESLPCLRLSVCRAGGAFYRGRRYADRLRRLSGKNERFVKRAAGALLFPCPFGYDKNGSEVPSAGCERRNHYAGFSTGGRRRQGRL